jgi:hypothetical protein
MVQFLLLRGYVSFEHGSPEIVPGLAPRLRSFQAAVPFRALGRR